MISQRLEVALEAAKRAGRKLRCRFRKAQEVKLKGVIDLVTKMDIEAEEEILAHLRKAFPEDSFLTEESGGEERRKGVWIIDPLDGTTNYAHGVPFYAVSIAWVKEREALLGVVYNPQLKECFWAEKGAGALLNGKAISVSERRELDCSLVATGFPYDVRQAKENNLTFFKRAQLHTRGVRRLGAASLDLAYVACGIYDGYWELRLKPWDVAAGALLVSEAGGQVTTLSCRKFTPFSSSYLATNGQIHRALYRCLHAKS